MKVEIEWFSIKDKLPIIPEGKYGIPVLVNIYDYCYEECSPGNGSHVAKVNYSKTRDKNGNKDKYYEDSELEEDFMELVIGDGWENTHFEPIDDEVTHWAYMPEPIKIKKD